MSRRRSRHPEFDDRDPLLDATVVDKIDLHGYTAAEARHRLSADLARLAQHHKGEVVLVITGRGRHSQVSAVLPRMVRGMLGGSLQKYVSDFRPTIDGGGYRVRLA